MKTVHKWQLFTPSPFFAILKWNLAPPLPNSSKSTTYQFKKYWNLFPSEGPGKGRKKINKPPDGKYKPSAEVMYKIPDTFPHLNKAFLLEGGK